jgi:hypothetical protein
MKRTLSFLAVCWFVFTAESCDGSQTQADKVQGEQVALLNAEAARQTGMPGITNFTEKKFAKYLYELRDQEGFSTYTYIVDLNGGLHFVCESIGYGIPYSVQYVSPGYHLDEPDGGDLLMPQAEPNGMFMPDGLSATWVLCSDGQGGVKPVYSEPQLLVSPFPLSSVDAYQQLGQ